MGKRINKCPSWDEHWGCAISPMKNCDSCANAEWVNTNKKPKKEEMTKQQIKEIIGKCVHAATEDYMKDEAYSKDEMVSKICLKLFTYIENALDEE